MFDKREIRPFPGVRRDDLWPKAWDWWSRQGFHLTQTGPYMFHGTSFYSRIGLRRELDLRLDEAGGTSTIDLSFRAQITEEGAIAGAVTAVILLPVALVGGAISYTEYETDARNLMLAFWQSLAGAAVGPARPESLPTPCSGCGAALLPDWKLCPYCGRSRTGAS